MAEEETRRSSATGRAKRTDDPSTSDQPSITGENGAETTMTPDESRALTLRLTQEHAIEEAVSSAVQGAASLVRSVIPSVLLRPDETIDMTLDLADQGLLLLRRLSHEVFGAVRSTLAPSGVLVAA